MPAGRGAGRGRIDYAYLAYLKHINDEVLRITNGRPDLYPPVQVFALRRQLMGDQFLLRKKVAGDKVNKPVMWVGVAFFVVFSILAIAFQAYGDAQNDQSMSTWAGFAAGGSGFFCALLSMWLACAPGPLSIGFSFVGFMYSMAGGILGVLGIFFLRPITKKGATVPSYTWTAYAVTVVCACILLLQFTYFTIMVITACCRKSDYMKYFNQQPRVETWPLPPNYDPQQQRLPPGVDMNAFLSTGAYAAGSMQFDQYSYPQYSQPQLQSQQMMFQV